jgi:monoterpene epsilon-lactone hydrolase
MTEPVPAPAFLSEQARAVLAEPRVEEPFPALDDTEGWLRRIAAANEASRAQYAGAESGVQAEERQIAGVPTYVLRADDVPDDDRTPVYLDIHGGGLIYGGGDVARLSSSRTAAVTGLIHWAVDYRVPPLHPFPAALDDVAAVYRTLLEQRDPADIVVGGGSAGGNLAAALLLRVKDEGLPMPSALVLLTPEVDLTESGDSFQTVAGFDNTLGSLRQINLLYAGGRELTDPYLSPLLGDPSGFPRTLITAGTRDLFLSNAVRMHRRLRDAGVDAELHVFEARPHGGFGGAPEDLEVYAELRRFLGRHRPESG